MRIAPFAIWLMANPSWAQDGFDAHGLVVVPQAADSRGTVTLRRPALAEAGNWSASGLLEYAEQPLVGTAPSGEVTPILDDLMVANLGGRVAVHERLSLDLAVPLVLASRGRESFSGPTAGDMRAAMQATLVAPGERGLGLGAAGWLDLPTGNVDRFLGQPSVAGGGALLATLELDALTLTGNLGAQFNPSVDASNVVGSDAAQLGLGVGYQFRSDLSALMEVVASAPFEVSTARGTGAPVEGRWYGRWTRATGGFVLGGVSAGLTPGIGAAVARVFVGGGFGSAPEAAVAVQDNPESAVEPVRLAIAVLDDRGAPLEGAEVRLEGPRTEAVQAPGALQVLPGSLWRGDASAGACLAGSQVTQVHETDAEMTIEMGWLGGVELALLVMDAGGQVVDDAAVTVVSSDPHCGPRSPVQLQADGSARFEVGLATHTITVTTEDGRTASQTVDGKAGAVTEVILLLGVD